MLTFTVQPQVVANFRTWPVGFILPALAIAGLAGVQFELRRGKELNAFLASCTYLLGMLTSVVFGVYPMVLPARNPTYSLTVTNAKAADYGLKIGLIWWVIGMILAAGYFIYVYRTFAGKVAAEPLSCRRRFRLLTHAARTRRTLLLWAGNIAPAFVHRLRAFFRVPHRMLGRSRHSARLAVPTTLCTPCFIR